MEGSICSVTPSCRWSNRAWINKHLEEGTRTDLLPSKHSILRVVFRKADDLSFKTKLDLYVFI